MINKETEFLRGQILLKTGLITQQELDKAMEEQKKTGGLLSESLLVLGYVTEDNMIMAIMKELGISYLELRNAEIDPEAIKKIPADLAMDYVMVPVKIEEGTLTLAIADPMVATKLEGVRLLTGLEINTVIGKEKDILDLIKLHYGVGAETVVKMGKDRSEEIKLPKEKDIGSTEIKDMASNASIINFVNQIIVEALRTRATDIHIEPGEKTLHIRYRIDGILHKIPVASGIGNYKSPIVSRIKVMSKLDIAERRLPQSGRIDVKVGGHTQDLRVSVIPTYYGESINIRVLDKNTKLLSLEELGFSEDTLEKTRSILQLPHGMILLTGSTGCGKSTSLYAFLNSINTPEKKIITVEDPIEYQLEGVDQMQVNEKAGLHFSTGLRNILRHDPDIIMIGEIRDSESAHIAIQAALTGHLVFSTLHTNDAPSAIARLVDLEVEPFLVSSSLSAVLAQRLVRIICPHCKEEYTPPAPILNSILKEINLDSSKEIKIFRGRGCEECRFTGYQGRTALTEIMVVSLEIKDLIVKGTDDNQIKNILKSTGMKTLREEGYEKVLSGITTIEEVLRVT